MKHKAIKNQKLKKIRGKKRKVIQLCRRIANRTKEFPLSSLCSRGYFDYKLPAYQGFIDCTYQATDIRKQVCQALVDATTQLIHTKPHHLQHTKVVLLLTLPDLFYASINVFFDQDYYKSFFQRDTQYQTWSLINFEGSQASQYDLIIPTNTHSKVIQETIIDEDCSYTSEIFLIGEVSKD